MLKNFALILILASSTLFAMENVKRSPEKLAQIQEQILESVKERKADFNRIRDENKPVEAAWQEMFAILESTSKEIVSQHGYPDTYAGTQQFTLEYILAQANRPDLAKINEDLTSFMFFETFGMMSEEEAFKIGGQAVHNIHIKPLQKKIKEVENFLSDSKK